jgi:hypothetical protein
MLENSSSFHYKFIRVVERAGVNASSFPVSLELDTSHLLAGGGMHPGGSDIHVAIAGEEIPCQVEEIDGKHTFVAFQIDLRPDETRDDSVVYFGSLAGADPKPALWDNNWGAIRPTMDGFENSLLRISYGLKTGTYGKKWGCQNEFTIKSADEDQFGGSSVPQSWGKSRNDVTYWKENVPARFQAVEADGPVYKRIRFFTGEVVSDDHGRLRDLSLRVTFYRDCPFIREEYRNIKGAVVDVATPGGMPLRTGGKRNFGFAAFNFDSKLITWNGIGDDRETRGGWDARRDRAEKDPRYRYLNDYVYNGHFVMGVFNIYNGRGLANCALAEDIQTCYFVDWPHERAGYSLWPRKQGKMNRYFYYTENGREGLLSLGKILANPPEVNLTEILHKSTNPCE